MELRLRQLVPERGTPRVLAGATFVDTFGNGLFLTVAALYLTRKVGLSPRQLGVALSIGALAGLPVGFAAGHLADRIGAKAIMLPALCLSSVASVGLISVGGFAAVTAMLCVAAMADTATSVARQALIARTVAPETRVRTRAYLRSVTNLAISLGAVVGGLALHSDARSVYQAMLLGDGASYLLTAALLTRLPADRPEPTGQRPRASTALRDRPFVVLTGLNAVLCLHYGLTETAVPLWIAGHTAAPRIMVSGVLLVNTTLCVLFQVRASRGIDSVPASALAQRRAGVLLLAACAGYAISGGRSAAVAVALLVAAMVVHTTGELLQAAGSWGLGFGLAPDTAQGQYQALWQSSFALSTVIGPAAVTFLAVSFGPPGWLILGVIFLAAGTAVVPASRWAAATRRPPPPRELSDARSVATH